MVSVLSSVMWYFTGNTTFLKNRCNAFEASEDLVSVGAISAVASSLYFTGTSNFIDNVNSANNTINHAVGVGDAISV